MCSPWSFSCLDCRFPKHPWNNPGMHFCGISTEWLKGRQYHPKWKNKTAWVLDLQIPWNPEQELPAGQGQCPGALAQQGRGTGTSCFTLGGSQCLESPNWGGWEAQASLAFVFCGIHVPAVTSLHHCSRVRLVLKENSTWVEWKYLGLEMSFVKLK